MMIITKYVADWFARAEDDFSTASILLKEKISPNQICFHSQQIVEKYLKGFLAYHDKHVRKIHDIESLLENCRSIDNSFESLQNDARFLAPFYAKSRYPDDFVEFTREEAEKAFESAKRIKEFVLLKIK